MSDWSPLHCRLVFNTSTRTLRSNFKFTILMFQSCFAPHPSHEGDVSILYHGTMQWLSCWMPMKSLTLSLQGIDSKSLMLLIRG